MFQRAMFQLTESDQRLLLQIARNSVRAYLSGETAKQPEISNGVLMESYGVFVSIHISGELRGCIGNVHPAGPLYRSAAECAVAAAVSDPRFAPLTSDELPAADFEISVLSFMEPVKNIEEIEIGLHGLMITKPSGRGLLLPQVAVEHRWDRVRFLRETCKKAGLNPDDWKNGATIQRFAAFVFGESQLRLTLTT
jgi:AmmeMemoRadiSam system protein A